MSTDVLDLFCAAVHLIFTMLSFDQDYCFSLSNKRAEAQKKKKILDLCQAFQLLNNSVDASTYSHYAAQWPL